MDFNDSPEEAAWRAECRAWLEDNASFRRWFFPAGVAPSLASPAEAPPPHVITRSTKRALRVVS